MESSVCYNLKTSPRFQGKKLNEEEAKEISERVFCPSPGYEAVQKVGSTRGTLHMGQVLLLMSQRPRHLSWNAWRHTEPSLASSPLLNCIRHIPHLSTDASIKISFNLTRPSFVVRRRSTSTLASSAAFSGATATAGGGFSDGC